MERHAIIELWESAYNFHHTGKQNVLKPRKKLIRKRLCIFKDQINLLIQEGQDLVVVSDKLKLDDEKEE